MTTVLLIGSVTKGREKSAAQIFASLTQLVALAAMGMSAEDADPPPPPSRPRLTLVHGETSRSHPKR